MLEKLKSAPSLKQIEEAATQHKSLVFESLWDAPKALIATLLEKATGRSVLIISGGESESKLVDDIAYFRHAPPLEFPAWEALPGEEIPPNSDIVGRRFEILTSLLKEKAIVVTSLQAVLQKTIAPGTLAPLTLTWKKGQDFPFENIENSLRRLGYQRRPIVSDKGEFALRGGIVDLFPVSSDAPYRVEFFGDTIDNIRTFNPGSQKSVDKISSVTIGPSSEYTLLQEEQNPCTLVDYLKDPIILFDDIAALEDKYVALKDLPGAKPPYFTPFHDFLTQIEERQKVYFASTKLSEMTEVLEHGDEISFDMFQTKLRAALIDHPFERVLDLFPNLTDLAEAPATMQLHFLTSSDAEQKALETKLEGISLPEKTHYDRGYLSTGFYLTDRNFCLLPYPEISGRHKVHRQKWRQTSHTPISEFHELSPGDYVVHIHNGIGKYLGIEKQKSHEGTLAEFIVIEYAKGGKLFVPLSQSHLISRYIGAHEAKPELHQIGSAKWQRSKVSAQKAIIGYAQDLLNMQAEREVAGGFVFAKDSEDMLLFEEEFPFIETDDQLHAIAAIKNDMCSEKPMDRLVCGDVGYGKTEVAMRAAFKAVIDGGKQVAVLVPTTTLATQHYETFRDRMSSFPVRLGVLSRFVPKKEMQKTIEGIEKGSVDIVVGTHRLIGKDVNFKNLGLIIIDEEQRFGVRAKEHLKKFKAGVDCLTLSATPIPRTLYMSLIGARDLSTINTPPQDRLPIKTIIAEKESSLVKNALLREMARDGQAYYIHNRVETIHGVAKELEELAPKARIRVGHGQMGADNLDTVFHDFKAGIADVFVATTIVESGIDIPNANTIIIERADTFGLADLYQLRGRVGRWNRPAYAYFLTPPNRELPEVARKRLQALVETSGFGGGMKLAMRDLEIRGAGDLLGVKQSGHVSSVGFHLYCKMLKKTINAMKKKQPTTFLETKMEFPFDAQIPESYVPETSIRLELYHRLGDAESPATIQEIREELVDRFGPTPNPVELLLHLTNIRIYANARNYTLLKYHKQTLITHRQRKKELEKKTQVIPFFKSPAEFEQAICSLL